MHYISKLKSSFSVLSTLKKPSKNYTCYILRRFGLFLIDLQSKNKETLDNASNSSQNKAKVKGWRKNYVHYGRKFEIPIE